MGKKTKKEKILTEYRRKLQLVNQTLGDKRTASSHTAAPTIENKPLKYELPKIEMTSGLAHANDLISDKGSFSYVATDLKRILFLTALAICAQVVLWYYLGTKMIGK